MFKLKWLRHKTFYDVISVTYGLKYAQISESDFVKPQNWDTFPTLGT